MIVLIAYCGMRLKLWSYVFEF